MSKFTPGMSNRGMQGGGRATKTPMYFEDD